MTRADYYVTINKIVTLNIFLPLTQNALLFLW
jgi:hypothetical protein